MQLLHYIFTLLIIVGLGACGGGGSGGGGQPFQQAPSGGVLPAPAPEELGAIIDSAITGLHFETNTASGITGAGGTFPFVEGESITFSIGGIALPTIPVLRTITPLDIFGVTDPNDISVVNFSRLVQTLDVDGDPSNGIAIDAAAHAAAAGMSIQFDSPTFETDVATLVANSGSVNTTLVATEDAVAHLQSTIRSLADPGVYFEVYGASRDDYDLDIGSQTLLGTSHGGVQFDTTGYDRITIYIPPTSEKVYIDSLVFGFPAGGEGGIYFSGSSDGFDPVIFPRIANLNITDPNGGEPTSLCGSITSACDGWFTSEGSDLPIEANPDGLSMESIPGLPSYITLNVEYIEPRYIRVVLANPLHRPLTCGYTTPFYYDNPVISRVEPTNSFDDFLMVVEDCGGAANVSIPEVVAREGYFFSGDGFLHFLAFDSYNPATQTGAGAYEVMNSATYDMLWNITEGIPMVYGHAIIPDGNEDPADDAVIQIYIARTSAEHSTIFVRLAKSGEAPFLRGLIYEGERF